MCIDFTIKYYFSTIFVLRVSLVVLVPHCKIYRLHFINVGAAEKKLWPATFVDKCEIRNV